MRRIATYSNSRSPETAVISSTRGFTPADAKSSRTAAVPVHRFDSLTIDRPVHGGSAASIAQEAPRSQGAPIQRAKKGRHKKQGDNEPESTSSPPAQPKPFSLVGKIPELSAELEKNTSINDSYKTFIAHLQSGEHPLTAAQALGDSNPKKLKGASGNLHEARLSQKHRILFSFDDKDKTVKVHQVGGHT